MGGLWEGNLGGGVVVSHIRGHTPKEGTRGGGGVLPGLVAAPRKEEEEEERKRKLVGLGVVRGEEPGGAKGGPGASSGPWNSTGVGV